MYRAAIAAILSELNRQGRLTIVEAFDVEASKTSGLVSKLKDFELGRRPLIVTEEASEHLYLSARNLPYVDVRDVQGLDPVALVTADSVLVTSDAVKKIEEWLRSEEHPAELQSLRSKPYTVICLTNKTTVLD